ncbi:lipopolysaccharide biosynthesis protein [Novosphingobium aquae]|uniref:Lipopolysaccharide biosynthesis protein n=1 Tax=Novosphingobium aquae TaxID=3133435 RepID=A0ABU8S700_9SPHN
MVLAGAAAWTHGREQMSADSSEMTKSSDDPGHAITQGAKANAAGLLLRLAARAAFLFMAARLFGPRAYGNFVLSVAVIELCVSVGSLGVKKTLFPLLDRAEVDGKRPLVHVVIDAAVMIGIASVALAAMISALGFLLAPPDVAVALALIAPMIACQALIDLAVAAVRWRGRVRYEIIGRSVLEPWILASCATGAVLAGLESSGLAIGYWCGTLSALAYACWGIAREFPKPLSRSYSFDYRGAKQLLAMAPGNSSNDLLNALYYRIDIYIVGIVLGPVPTGIYGLARQLTTPIRQVRQSFDSLLVPGIARIIDQCGVPQTTLALSSSIRQILALQLPMLVAALAIGQPLLQLLGPGFEAGYHVLIILCAAEILQSAMGLGDLVFVYRKPGLGLAITLVSVATSAVLAIFLMPRFGITGAALASFAAYCVRSVLRVAALRWQFRLTLPLASVAVPSVAAGLAIVPALLIASPLMALGAALLVYAIVLKAGLAATGQTLQLAGFDREYLSRLDSPT